MTKKEASIISNEYPIVFYDGLCHLCHGAINFLLKKDKKDRLRFAHLQSSLGQEVFGVNFNIESPKSIYVLHQGEIQSKSSGVLFTFKFLTGISSLLYGFIIAPKFIRNGVYDYVSKHRYGWFGKNDSCLMPTLQIKNKFIE